MFSSFHCSSSLYTHTRTHTCARKQDDLLASLLDASVYPNTNSSDYVPLNFDLDPTHLLYPQNSPLTSDGYASDSSTLYKTNSPASCISVLGNSPVYEGASPRHSPLVSSSVLEQPGPGEDISTLLGLGEAMELRLADGMEPSISSTAESLPRDVKIDVGEYLYIYLEGNHTNVAVVFLRTSGS